MGAYIAMFGQLSVSFYRRNLRTRLVVLLIGRPVFRSLLYLHLRFSVNFVDVFEGAGDGLHVDLDGLGPVLDVAQLL